MSGNLLIRNCDIKLHNYEEIVIVYLIQKKIAMY